MKLHYLLAFCLALSRLSVDSVEARALTSGSSCSKPNAPCPKCKYGQRCCGIKDEICSKQCNKVCVKPDRTKFPVQSTCPLKTVCKNVSPESCKKNQNCKCTRRPVSHCKPVCKTLKKEVCEPYCEECISCEEIPDCNFKCGSGYCDGNAEETCEDDVCKATCTERFVPRCVPGTPSSSKTPDDDDDKKKKKKKKGDSSGSDSDSSGSDSESSRSSKSSKSGSDSDSDSDSDSSKSSRGRRRKSGSGSDSSDCGSSSDSDYCYKKHHH